MEQWVMENDTKITARHPELAGGFDDLRFIIQKKIKNWNEL
jgi:hypothetical protein